LRQPPASPTGITNRHHQQASPTGITGPLTFCRVFFSSFVPQQFRQTQQRFNVQWVRIQRTSVQRFRTVGVVGAVRGIGGGVGCVG